MTKIWQMLVLSAAALALSTLPGRAGPCAQEIDRAWAQVDAKNSSPNRSRALCASERDRPSPPPANTELDRGSSEGTWPGVDPSGGGSRRTGEGARSRPSRRQERLLSDPCTGATGNRADSLDVFALALMGLL